MSAADRVEVFADGVEMPAGDEVGGGLNDMPCLPDELTQAAPGYFPVDLSDEGRS